MVVVVLWYIYGQDTPFLIVIMMTLIENDIIIIHVHTSTHARIQASLLVADSSVSFEITGLGDVLEPKDGVIAIGSGGTFALGACVLYPHTFVWHGPWA